MNKFLIRFFDIVFSFFGLIVVSPIFIVIIILILVDSRGGVFYRQSRVGKNDKDFLLWKFRTMYTGSDKGSLITIGKKDSRITRIGYSLRKYKLDELPQLFNVLTGEMSFVGPRPEVRKYVDLYTEEQQKVLQVKPGITDYASIEYSDENEILAASLTPETYYVEVIMPAKINLNMKYISNPTFWNYIKIIWKTLVKIIK